MSFCYDFEKWTMVTLGLVVITLSLGLLLQVVHGQNENSEKLYDECVIAAGKGLCDFLFRDSMINTDSSSSLSNYTSSPSVSSPINSTHATYKDDNNGFSIQHPSDWVDGYHNTEYGTVIGFAPPEEENAYVDVRVLPKGDFKSIKEYGDMFKESDQHNLLAYYRNSTTELGGKPAFRGVYLLTFSTTFAENLRGIESEPAKGLIIGTIVPEKDSLYSIVYLTDPQVFDKYLPVVENMIKSFKIYGKGPVIQEDDTATNSSGANITELNNTNDTSDNNPEELYDECVRVAGKDQCDFLFRK
jgi:PsbP